MKKSSLLLPLFIFALLSMPKVGRAEEKDPSRFFDRGFAAQVGAGGAAEMVSSPEPTATAAATPRRDTEISAPQQSNESRVEKLEQVKDKLIKQQMAEGRGTPVKYVGAVINALDQAHYWAKLKELADMALEKKLPIAVVYTVGPQGEAKDIKTLAILESFGFVNRTVREVPNRYPVQLSPAWIFGTAEGEILVEGDDPLASWLNSRNEFVVAP